MFFLGHSVVLVILDELTNEQAVMHYGRGRRTASVIRDYSHIRVNAAANDQ